jgi:hypothetical protein
MPLSKIIRFIGGTSDLGRRDLGDVSCVAQRKIEAFEFYLLA